MNGKSAGNVTPDSSGLAQWKILLRDEMSLLAMPGAHHQALLRQAHVLHQHM